MGGTVTAIPWLEMYEERKSGELDGVWRLSCWCVLGCGGALLGATGVLALDLQFSITQDYVHLAFADGHSGLPRP